MAYRHLLSLFMLLGICSAPAGAALSCADCSTQMRLLSDHQGNHKTQVDLLQRNRDYLATLTKNDISKSIKVKSNILILLVRIETLKNNIESLREEANTKLCQACARATKR